MIMMMRIMSCMSKIVRHIVCHELSFDTVLLSERVSKDFQKRA
jgi:hypothetical protein